uniref:Uncharacterized protein n=1 Tax=Anguilla anguilla TaxID=7936 RepID=A0A0E9XAR3_ANGAN
MCFMITLIFVYYLCIIEFECTLCHKKHQFRLAIYNFLMFCKIVPSALPHFKNKLLQIKH